MPDMDEGALQRGPELGAGGQAWVYRVYGQQEPLAYKKYKDPGKADPAALKTLIDLPATLQPSQRDRLHEQAAWPLARVYDHGQLSGFFMREIPAQFMGPNTAGKSILREVQFLLYQRKPMWGDIVPAGGVGSQTRIDVAREFSALMTLFHAKALVIGDVSMRNVLWRGTDGQSAAIFLLDCDGIRQLGQAPVMAQAETPDWNDPNQTPNGPDLDTDRYKLALLVGRVLSCQAYIRPDQDPLSLPADLPDRTTVRIEALWRQAARPYGQRPAAHQWQQALGNRDEITVSTPRVRDRYPQGVDKAPEVRPDTGPRPSIPVTPPILRPAPVASPATPSAQRLSIPVRPPQSPTP
jgi:DNA-binding helix-hairpin-helix protein with protein kinase domain